MKTAVFKAYFGDNALFVAPAEHEGKPVDAVAIWAKGAGKMSVHLSLEDATHLAETVLKAVRKARTTSKV